MLKEKEVKSKDSRWPLNVSGSTASHYSVSMDGASVSREIFTVTQCMSELSAEFNMKYSGKEKLISLVTETLGYNYGETNYSFGSVAFHVTSMETNKTRRIMNLEILNQTAFNVELSIFANMGREVMGIANSCEELKDIFFEVIKDGRVTEQLKLLRKQGI